MFVEYSIYFQIATLMMIYILLKEIRFLGGDSTGKSHGCNIALEALRNHIWPPEGWRPSTMHAVPICMS